jgi:hypothetical protein
MWRHDADAAGYQLSERMIVDNDGNWVIREDQSGQFLFQAGQSLRTGNPVFAEGNWESAGHQEYAGDAVEEVAVVSNTRTVHRRLQRR